MEEFIKFYNFKNNKNINKIVEEFLNTEIKKLKPQANIGEKKKVIIRKKRDKIKTDKSEGFTEHDKYLKAFCNFINNSYIPFNPTIKQLNEEGRFKGRFDDNYKQMQKRARKMLTWKGYRDDLTEDFKQFIKENHNEDKYKPTPYEISLYAMMKWEDVFMKVTEKEIKNGELLPFEQRILESLKFLLLSWKTGFKTVGHLQPTHIEMALADVLFLASKKGLLRSSDKLIEKKVSEIYRSLINKIGDAHGRINELRYIYLMRKAGIEIVHAPPFMDYVENKRNDVCVFLGKIVHKFNLKSSKEAGGDIFIDNDLFITFQILIKEEKGEKELTSSEKKQKTRTINKCIKSLHRMLA